jgi:hypothetical protein
MRVSLSILSSRGRDSRHCSTYSELLVLVGDASSSVDEVHVVGNDGVAAVLGNETDRDNDCEPPAVSLGLHEVEIAGGVAGRPLKLEGLADLAILELDSGVLVVSIGVKLGQNREGFLVAVLGNQEPRGLGYPL